MDAVNQQAHLDSAPAYVSAYRATVNAAVATSRSYLAAAGTEMPQIQASPAVLKGSGGRLEIPS